MAGQSSGIDNSVNLSLLTEKQLLQTSFAQIGGPSSFPFSAGSACPQSLLQSIQNAVSGPPCSLQPTSPGTMNFPHYSPHSSDLQMSNGVTSMGASNHAHYQLPSSLVYLYHHSLSPVGSANHSQPVTQSVGGTAVNPGIQNGFMFTNAGLNVPMLSLNSSPHHSSFPIIGPQPQLSPVNMSTTTQHSSLSLPISSSQSYPINSTIPTSSISTTSTYNHLVSTKTTRYNESVDNSMTTVTMHSNLNPLSESVSGHNATSSNCGNMIDSGIVGDQKETKNTSTVTSSKGYTCEVCGRMYRMRCRLLTHQRCHTGERPFLCDICGRGFADRGNLCRHKASHTGERRYQCQNCNKTFRQPSVLSTHRRLHCSGRSARLCPHCSRAFTTSSSLRMHIRWKHKDQSDILPLSVTDTTPSHNMEPINTVSKGDGDHESSYNKEIKQELEVGRAAEVSPDDERPVCDSKGRVKHFHCTICTQSFLFQCRLEAHMRSHTNSRPFACKDCGRSFTQRGYLARHSAVHSTERPFVCSLCDRTYKHYGSLVNHRRSHRWTKKNPLQTTVSSLPTHDESTDDKPAHLLNSIHTVSHSNSVSPPSNTPHAFNTLSTSSTNDKTPVCYSLVMLENHSSGDSQIDTEEPPTLHILQPPVSRLLSNLIGQSNSIHSQPITTSFQSILSFNNTSLTSSANCAIYPTFSQS